MNSHPSRKSTYPNLKANIVMTLLVLGVPLGTKLILSSASAATSKQVEATGPMQAPRHGHTATVLPDGKVLIVGGVGTNNGVRGVLDSIELYATNQFSSVGDAASPTRLTQARTAHTATLARLADGSSRVIIAGGLDSSATPTPLSTIEIFDPASGAMVGADHMTTARSSHTATVLADGRIFFAGGDPAGTAEIYDPNTLLGPVEPVEPVQFQLSDPRWGHTATLFSDNTVFLAGGGTQTAEFVNTASGAMSTIQLLAIRYGHTAIVGTNQNVYLIGGDQANSVERYNPFDVDQPMSPVTMDLPVPGPAESSTLLSEFYWS